MIYKIRFQIQQSSLVPFNNKYKLNCYIYNLIKSQNVELFDLLHNNKILVENRPITPFVFSNLFFDNFEIFKNHGFLVEGGGTWYFSSPINSVCEIFESSVKSGILLGNLILNVQSIEKIEMNFNNNTFKSISPVVINITEGKLRKQLSPSDITYIYRIKKNIIRKYKYLFSEVLNENDFDVKVISYNKDGKIEFYKDKYIKSYDCLFEITGGDRVKQTVLSMGVGAFNCMGFGFLIPVGGVNNVIRNNKKDRGN